MRLRGFLSFLFTGRPFSDKEIKAVRNEVSFSDAIEAHLAWKRVLSQCIEGDSADVPLPSELAHDRNCVLGQWIHGAGKHRYGDLPAFLEIQTQHERFHHLAGEIATLYRANQIPRAKALMAGEFEASSRDIVARMHRMAEVFGS